MFRALYAGLLCWFGTAAIASVPKNVLLLVAEDMGLQLGCYGDPVSRTPRLDRFAREGVRFSRAYVTQAGCSPSRASILTGLYPHQHGQIGLATHKFAMFSAEIPNLPRILGEQGYRTGCIGKIHVNPESAFAFHHHQGNKEEFSTRDVVAVAGAVKEFVQASDRPFFLMVNFADTHDAWLPQHKGLPAKPLRADEVRALPFVGINSPEARQATADYYSCISRLDTGIGLVLDELSASGRADDTLVVFLSDHGPAMPRGKMTCYEGGMRVPLLVRKPGTIPSGRVDERLVSAVDLLPTILDHCGVALPKGLAGMSLLPGLSGPENAWRETLFAEFTIHWSETYFPQRSVRNARYKLVHNLIPGRVNPLGRFYRTRVPALRFDDLASPESVDSAVREAYVRYPQPPEWELFDLVEDPWENHNLAARAELAGVLQSLQTELKSWQAQTNDALRIPENLARFSREVEETFIAGKYVGVSRRPEFQWRYSAYLMPVASREVGAQAR